MEFNFAAGVFFGIFLGVFIYFVFSYCYAKKYFPEAIKKKKGEETSEQKE